MDNVYIVAPRNAVAGGIELLHQLGHTLNEQTRRAWMVYYPFGEQGTVPVQYRRYRVDPIRFEDVPHGANVVMPEIYAKLVPKFPSARIFFWWLSVDNFFLHAKLSLVGRLMGGRLVATRQLVSLRTSVFVHLYQSEYARQFISSVGLEPSLPLSDYIAEEYSLAEDVLNLWPRQDLVVYNPMKGIERTTLIIDALRENAGGPPPRVVPLTGMNREQVRDLLRQAKVYIDFGGHPGKDRIPREAAAMGACILVNRRGSASNSIDIPIPDDFKYDDRQRGFERRVALKIRDTLDNFEHDQKLLTDYRKIIASESLTFERDVRSVFSPHS